MSINVDNSQFAVRSGPNASYNLKDTSVQPAYRLTLNGFTIVLQGSVLILRK